jgi:hypothetical protein
MKPGHREVSPSLPWPPDDPIAGVCWCGSRSASRSVRLPHCTKRGMTSKGFVDLTKIFIICENLQKIRTKCVKVLKYADTRKIETVVRP